MNTCFLERRTREILLDFNQPPPSPAVVKVVPAPVWPYLDWKDGDVKVVPAPVWPYLDWKDGDEQLFYSQTVTLNVRRNLKDGRTASSSDTISCLEALKDSSLYT